MYQKLEKKRKKGVPVRVVEGIYVYNLRLPIMLITESYLFILCPWKVIKQLSPGI